jgi:hypothetical protein
MTTKKEKEKTHVQINAKKDFLGFFWVFFLVANSPYFEKKSIAIF